MAAALTEAGTSGAERCASYSGGEHGTYPLVNPNNQPSDCLYPTGDSTCSATSGGYTRLCKCDLPPPTPTPAPTPPPPAIVTPPIVTPGSWVLQTTTNEACTDTCAASGQRCEDGYWGADSEATLDAALAEAGTVDPATRCSSYVSRSGARYGMIPAIPPALYAPSGCHYNTGDSTCRETSGYNRLCKCIP